MSLHPDTLRDLLEGHALPENPRCSRCGHPLHEGARCAVVAREIDDGVTWEANSIYCLSHAPHTAPATPFGTSVLATADIAALVDTAAQSHRPCLLSVEIVNHALDNDTDNDIGCAPIRVAEEDGGVAR